MASPLYEASFQYKSLLNLLLSPMLSKRFSIKMLASAFVLVMALCVSAYAATKTGSWSVNPADFRYDMSLYFALSDRSLEDLDKYEIGAFVDDECRGVAERLELTDGESCLYMRIRSNTAQGAEVEFRIREKDSEEYTLLKPESGETFIFKSNERVGMPSTPFILDRYFNISVSAAEHGGIVDFTDGWYKQGSQLMLMAVADEGCHFVQWSDGNTEAERILTVEESISLQASFAVNIYKVVFSIDGEVYRSLELAYGTAIPVPEAPANEGYTFSGWGDVPGTVPASDLEFYGTYNLNRHMIVFRIGDEVIFEGEMPYGSEIVAPEPPVKEGHTFAGWGPMPSVMPDSAVEVIGSYSVNSYTLTFDIDGVVYSTETLAYGSVIAVPVNVPEKDGHVFMGWGDVPVTMPAYDLTVSGTYAVNHYTLTFRIGEEILFTGEQPYGSEIVAPEVPEREGYTFSGWGEVPATMPSRNLEITGSYDPLKYTLTFKIDEEVIFSESVDCGSVIEAPEAPEKEGYSFTGWGVVPATMPASDLELTGTYEINYYNLVFKVGDEVVLSAQVPYGTEIVAPEVAEKEGYSFSGWGEVPSTMPAKDLEISGSYEVNSYKITFIIDGEVISETTLAYGDTVVEPTVPEKEGYSFAGWEALPATMPARDVEVVGAYSINYYVLTVYLNDEVYFEARLAYGSEIEVPEPELEAGDIFNGWDEEIPSVMPAHDVQIHGTVEKRPTSAVSGVIDGEVCDVYSISGVLLYRGVNVEDVKSVLSPGVYIVGGKKMTVK